MNYYNRHIGDYAKKAGHLSPLEHGVYGLLLDSYYDREQGPTPLEAVRWSRARSPEELAALEMVLSEFFKLKNGRYVQARVEEEFHKWAEYQEKQRAKGKKGGRPRKATANPEESCGFSTESQSKAEPKPGKATSTNPLIHQEAKSKAVVRLPSATRLPADWTLTPERLAYCQTKRPDLDPIGTFEDFEDYWRALPGNKGLKLDWDRTWKKWVRGQNAQRGSPANRPSAPSKQLTGVAGFLGVSAHDLLAEQPRPAVVHQPDSGGASGLVPAEPRRLSGE